MKINQIQNSQTFKGIYNNKLLLSSLEKISDNSASFISGVSFLSATFLRPLAISATPKIDKENKKFFSVDSFSSALMKLVIALCVSAPIEKSVKFVEENKNELLSNETLKRLSDKDLKFITQIIKQGANIIASIPKSILGVALIPVLLDFVKLKKDDKNNTLKNIESFSNFKNATSFRGNKINNFVTSIIESKKVQDFALKNSINDKNISRNVSVLNDILLTSTSALALCTSKKIDKERKKPLILNKIISTGISIIAGCSLDILAQKLGNGFVEKFKTVNSNDKKLLKYLEGINVLRPTLIFALVYYGAIPSVSAFVSDRLTNLDKDKKC